MPRTIIGTVVSVKADKTITVKVETKRSHNLYDKQYVMTNKFLAHDEKNEAKTGDKVEITESRPISKRKSWILSRIIESSNNLENTI